MFVVGFDDIFPSCSIEAALDYDSHGTANHDQPLNDIGRNGCLQTALDKKTLSNIHYTLDPNCQKSKLRARTTSYKVGHVLIRF